MKNFIPFLFLISCSFFSYSQNVGIGTNTPHTSAALDIQDSSRGMLIPRMTMVQRNAIQNPAEGLMVYQTDSTKGFWYYTMTQWKLLIDESPGNSIIKGLNHIGFARSATWVCPEGISRIEVELWGAGGGCGSTFVMKYGNNATFCIGQGGKGGKGGYLKQTIDVTPGLTYSIIIGNKGTNGILTPSPFSGFNTLGNWAEILYPTYTPNTIDGTDGGGTSFNDIMASGGKGGKAARFVNNTCIEGTDGNNGTLNNFIGVDFSTPIPSYVPTNYIRSYPVRTAIGGEPNNTVDKVGENGYCIISY
jgi:hypothetical protein